MIGDMEANKKLSPIITELFLRWGEPNTSLVFISQSYLRVPKTIRLNGTHYFIMKTSNKSELQQIRLNHSADIEFKGLMKLYKYDTKEAYSF